MMTRPMLSAVTASTTSVRKQEAGDFRDLLDHAKDDWSRRQFGVHLELASRSKPQASCDCLVM